jgi:hypothetical protein
MDFGNIISKIGQAAPWIATALGGPFAGKAVSLLTGALGISGDSKPDDIADAITTTDPVQLAAIKKADDELRLAFAQMDITRIEDVQKFEIQKLTIETADTADARRMHISVQENTVRNLAYVTTFGFFALVTLMFFVPMPPGAAEVIIGMVGSLGTVWITVMGFFFGSSRGSQAKDTTIANLAKT